VCSTLVIIPTCCVPRLPPGGSERYWLSFVFLLLFLDTGCVHLISLMWLEDVIASSSSLAPPWTVINHSLLVTEMGDVRLIERSADCLGWVVSCACGGGLLGTDLSSDTTPNAGVSTDRAAFSAPHHSFYKICRAEAVNGLFLCRYPDSFCRPIRSAPLWGRVLGHSVFTNGNWTSELSIYAR